MTLTTPVELTRYIDHGLDVLFLASALLFIGFSIALFYHIWYYSLNRQRALTAFFIYIGGGLLILVSMGITLLALA